MQDFIHNHLNDSYYLESEKVRQIAQKGYYGGRTEIFKRGTFENVSCYDINSLYPHSMMNEMPNPNSAKCVDVGSMYIINKYHGITDVTINIPDMYIPPLPYRSDKLLFPVGTISGYYTHIELRNALKHGCTILDIRESVYYSKTCRPFDTYVTHHYNTRKQLKKENNKLELMHKLLLNSLYGKFGFNYNNCSSIIQAKDIKDEHMLYGVKLVPLFDIAAFPKSPTATY
jgi:DNA polymerase elongation subunit (family B)